MNLSLIPKINILFKLFSEIIQIFLIIIIIINSYIFTQIKHPISLGLILFIQTLLTCILTGLIRKNFWISYILFLIFIGGMLILFIYISSLSPNLIIRFSSKIIIIFLIFRLLLIITLFLDKFFIINIKNNYDSLTNNKLNLLNNNTLLLSKIYNYPNNFLTIIIIIYLLLTLIIIVKISNSFIGPLRKNN